MGRWDWIVDSALPDIAANRGPNGGQFSASRSRFGFYSADMQALPIRSLPEPRARAAAFALFVALGLGIFYVGWFPK